MVAKMADLIRNDVVAAALAAIAGAAAFLISHFAGLDAGASAAIEGAGYSLLAFVPIAMARAKMEDKARAITAPAAGE